MGKLLQMDDLAPRSAHIARSGEPIRLVGWDVHGIAGESASAGAVAKVLTRLALTSDDPLFGRTAEKLGDIVVDRAAKAGTVLDMRYADSILLLIHEDDTADLWFNSALSSVLVRARRGISPGVVLRSDIADVIEFGFPDITILPKDRIIYIFRSYWRFGLYFDLWPNDREDNGVYRRELARLYRLMTYHHLYEAMEDETAMTALIENGWFPFVEILGEDFDRLLGAVRAGWSLNEEEDRLIESFDPDRMNGMFERWMSHPAFKSKEGILKEAFQAYAAKMPVSATKIIVTEIEGLLNIASRGYGEYIKKNKHAQYASRVATKRLGSGDTLIFASPFENYLQRYIWASNDARVDGVAGNRHAVSHGAAPSESYTQIRALKAFLALDQIFFCL